MFKWGITGGITQVVHRYASANNPYMGEKFSPSEESSYLQYLDANNLYGWAVSQSLPTGRLKWVSIKPNEIGELAVCTDKGYLLEVDVKYPKELHDSHNNLPFMWRRMKINSILPGGEYAPLLFFPHHPKMAQGIKLKLSDFKDTLLRHILQVKPVR